MTATKQGTMVVLSGPSGSGKTTVCRRLLEDPGIVPSISATTRAKRPGERDGVDYHFVGRDEFAARAARGEFAEHAEYNGNLYGTPREPLERALAEGHTVLVEIDVQGAAQLRRQCPDALYVFLDAPDRAAVQARLEGRNTESAEERRRRMETAERERSAARKGIFDHFVINDNLGETVEKIRALIRGGKPAARAQTGNPKQEARNKTQ